VSSLAQQLSALAEGAAALSGELDLDKVLERVVTSAAQVTGARYAALGVLGEGNRIDRFVTHGADQATIEAWLLARPRRPLPHLPVGGSVPGRARR
jgi:GAF domain-containing protein